MMFSRKKTLFINWGSLFLLISLLLKYQLHMVPLIIAVVVIIYNLYSIVSTYINTEEESAVSKDEKYVAKGQPRFNVKKFEEKFYEMRQRSQESGIISDNKENRYWDIKNVHETNVLNDLRKTRVNDLAKLRVIKSEGDN